MAAHAKINMRDAIAKAVAARSGEAAEAELENGATGVYYDITIITKDPSICTVQVDANNGRILKNVVEDSAKEIEELHQLAAVLSMKHMPLAEIVAVAEKSTNGVVIDASITKSGNRAVGSAKCVVGEKTQQVQIEGDSANRSEKSQKNAKMKSKDDEKDEDGDDDDDDDEKDGDKDK